MCYNLHVLISKDMLNFQCQKTLHRIPCTIDLYYKGFTMKQISSDKIQFFKIISDKKGDLKAY